jgi:hypothetical protein
MYLIFSSVAQNTPHPTLVRGVSLVGVEHDKDTQHRKREQRLHDDDVCDHKEMPK